MKICLLSDLHLEFCDYPYTIPKCDVLILAGDIDNHMRGIRWAIEKAPKKCSIVYVPGNHEFYNDERYSLLQEMLKTIWDERLYILNDMYAEIKGKRFFGGTLWTDYKVMGDQKKGMELASKSLNDHRLIMERTKIFTPQKALELHDASVAALDDDMYYDVIVTHHGPSPGCESSRFKGNEINGCFYSDLDWLIKKKAPKYWVHGHTHDSVNHKVGETFVIANPRGYCHPSNPFNCENRSFNPELILEL